MIRKLSSNVQYRKYHRRDMHEGLVVEQLPVLFGLYQGSACILPSKF